mmetsp:Transcript_29100/g.54461  ORF Transcript_29100/g.54461 Transcript_29100/m.54461 type:complete len:86 (-) Transcript_29100:377-634(-)
MDNVMTSGEFPHKERRPKDEVQKLEIPEGFEVSEDGDIVRMCFPGKGLAKVKQKRSYCEETTERAPTSTCVCISASSMRNRKLKA